MKTTRTWLTGAIVALALAFATQHALAVLVNVTEINDTIAVTVDDVGTHYSFSYAENANPGLQQIFLGGADRNVFWFRLRVYEPAALGGQLSDVIFLDLHPLTARTGDFLAASDIDGQDLSTSPLLSQIPPAQTRPSPNSAGYTVIDLTVTEDQIAGGATYLASDSLSQVFVRFTPEPETAVPDGGSTAIYLGLAILPMVASMKRAALCQNQGKTKGFGSLV